MKIRNLIWGFLAAGLLSLPAFASLQETASVADGIGQGGYISAVFDTTDNTGIFGTTTTAISPVSTASVLSTYNLSVPLSYSSSLVLFSSFTTISAGGFDPTSGAGFFVSSAAPSGLAKIPLTTAAQLAFSASSTTLSTGENFVSAMVLDTVNGFAYLGTQTSPAVVVKVRLTDLVEISSVTLPAGVNLISAAVIDVTNGFAYFGTNTSPGGVVKIKLSDLSIAGAAVFNSGEDGVGSAVIDTTKQLAYFGTHDSPGKVISVTLAGPARSSAVTLKVGENDLTSAVIDTSLNTGYFGTNTSSGIVVPITLSNMTEQASLTLAAGDNFLQSALIDLTNSYAYFGTSTTPGRVVQVDLLGGLPTITLNPSNTSAHPGDSATFAVVATGRNLTYQWLMNGAPIAGATTSAYTRVVSDADDGSTFQCVVTNVNGSVTSTAAQLTIIPIIRAFPNPWRSDRHAGINMTFDGLLANSTVKVFNLAGHWVKTLPLASNTTTWDLTNDQGEKVASGYYFYTVTTGNSKQTATGKIAIIH